MNPVDRRSFLQTTLGALGLSLANPAYSHPEKAKPRLAFSTLGCPNWSLATILEAAVADGYDAVEFRGLQGELNLTKSPAFNTPASARETRRLFADKGLKICDLGSSTQLHHAEANQRRQQMDEAKRYIDLAQQLDCPYVRVFPETLPKEQDRAATLHLIAQGLRELGEYANGSNVRVLLESHGELVVSTLLGQVMQEAAHPHVGMIWDIVNMWSVGGELPKTVYQALHPYIYHVHVKDVKQVDGKHNYVFLGEGEAPLKEAISALVSGGYTGYYSFEWEKLWHPEIAEPERAFRQYTQAIKTYF